MMLAVDARNLVLTVGFREESAPAGSWLAVRRCGASPDRTADEYAFFIEAASREALGRQGTNKKGIDMINGMGGCLSALVPEIQNGCRNAAGISGTEAVHKAGGDHLLSSAWVSSVVPALTPKLLEAIRISLGIEARLIGPGVRTGVKIRTDFPSEVGSDLVCEVAAAHELCPGPCLIIDTGAVLTISAVSAQGEFLGVAIAPGLRTAADSLKRIAAQLPEVRLDVPSRAIGRSTSESVQSGVVIGYQCLVRGLIERMSAELPAELDGPSGRSAGSCRAPVLIGTGETNAAAFLASCGVSHFEPELVLEGLAAIAARAGAL